MLFLSVYLQMIKYIKKVKKFENVILDRNWLNFDFVERAVITNNRLDKSLIKCIFEDVEVDQESLGCTKHFDTKFETFRTKKIHVKHRTFQNKQLADVSDPAGYFSPSGPWNYFCLVPFVLYRTHRAQRLRRKEKCWKWQGREWAALFLISSPYKQVSVCLGQYCPQ